jgi:hypothetical protein
MMMMGTAMASDPPIKDPIQPGYTLFIRGKAYNLQQKLFDHGDFVASSFGTPRKPPQQDSTWIARHNETSYIVRILRNAYTSSSRYDYGLATASSWSRLVVTEAQVAAAVSAVLSLKLVEYETSTQTSDMLNAGNRIGYLVLGGRASDFNVASLELLSNEHFVTAKNTNWIEAKGMPPADSIPGALCKALQAYWDVGYEYAGDFSHILWDPDSNTWCVSNPKHSSAKKLSASANHAL